MDPKVEGKLLEYLNQLNLSNNLSLFHHQDQDEIFRVTKCEIQRTINNEINSLTFFTVLSRSKAISGIFASSIRENKLAKTLACLRWSMERWWRRWEWKTYFRRISKAVKQCRKKCRKRSSSNISIISFDNLIGGGKGFGSRPRINPKSIWNNWPVSRNNKLSWCRSPTPNRYVTTQ